jgi:hypothetical protein
MPTMINRTFGPFSLLSFQSTRLPTEGCIGSLPREGDLFLRVALRESDGLIKPKAFVEGSTDAVCYTAKWL